MSAQPPVPIPPGITPGGVVTPTTDLRVKSLGVGEDVPPTAGDVNIAGSLYLGGNLTLTGTISTFTVLYASGFASLTPIATAITLVSGTKYQVDTTRNTVVHVQLTAAVAGTADITVIATTGNTTHPIAKTLKLLAASSQIVTVSVPKSWYLLVTAHTVTIKSALAVG